MTTTNGPLADHRSLAARGSAASAIAVPRWAAGWPGVLLAIGVGALAGLATDLFASRGPTTAAQALAIMALALATGVAGGLLARTRWILPALFLAGIVAIELGRRDLNAASLAFRFDNAYGLIMLVLTRGLHGILLGLPLAAGVLGGILLARRIGWLPGRGGRPIGTALVGIAAAALAVLVAWPASTPPVLGPDGRPVPGSIAELATVRLGGTDQAVMIRAADPDKPVLLYLSGGPGQSDLALSRSLSTGWVRDFVFVDLDQRGNGKSYPAIDPLTSMTLDRAVDDVIELAEYLCDRFDERRIYVMGESWGTILGVLAVQERPDLFHAFIGSGQMVNVLETDRRVYRDLVAHAVKAGDTELQAALDGVGAPPYRDFPWANSNLLAWYELLYPAYTPSEGAIARSDAAGLDPFGVLGSEYSLVEKADVLRGLMDTFQALYPQLYDVDLRERAASLEVPVYVLDGAAELDGRRDLALEWFEGLEAPIKRLVTYDQAAHSVAFEQADAVQELLTTIIVPETYARGLEAGD